MLDDSFVSFTEAVAPDACAVVWSRRMPKRSGTSRVRSESNSPQPSLRRRSGAPNITIQESSASPTATTV